MSEEGKPIETTGQGGRGISLAEMSNLVSYYKNGGFLWDAQIERRMNLYMGKTIRRIS